MTDTPGHALLRSKLLDREALVCTLYAEARGEPLLGQIAIACVIRNRTKAPPSRFGGSVRGVCFAHAAFSCWWGEDANTTLVYRLADALLSHAPLGPFNTPLLSELNWIVDGVIGIGIRDQVHGANHYLETGLFHSEDCPGWAQGQTPVAVIGSHSFLVLA